MDRCHQRELPARLKDGAIGPVRHVRADFGFRVRHTPEHRLFDVALGGGSILDVGGYPVSFARLGLAGDESSRHARKHAGAGQMAGCLGRHFAPLRSFEANAHSAIVVK